MHMAGISFGMQNLIRTAAEGVAFAQGPATSWNPDWMITDDVTEEQNP